MHNNSAKLDLQLAKSSVQNKYVFCCMPNKRLYWYRHRATNLISVSLLLMILLFILASKKKEKKSYNHNDEMDIARINIFRIISLNLPHVSVKQHLLLGQFFEHNNIFYYYQSIKQNLQPNNLNNAKYYCIISNEIALRLNLYFVNKRRYYLSAIPILPSAYVELQNE